MQLVKRDLCRHPDRIEVNVGPRALESYTEIFKRNISFQKLLPCGNYIKNKQKKALFFTEPVLSLNFRDRIQLIQSLMQVRKLSIDLQVHWIVRAAQNRYVICKLGCILLKHFHDEKDKNQFHSFSHVNCLEKHY